MFGGDSEGDYVGSNAGAGPDQEPPESQDDGLSWSAQAKNAFPSWESIWNLGKWGLWQHQPPLLCLAEASALGRRRLPHIIP
jgi:hypothetical protein